MTRAGTILLAIAISGCAAERTTETQAATTARFDPAAAQELRAEFERMLGLWEAMDLEGLKRLLAGEGFLASYDIDLEGKPLRMASREEAVRYIEEVFAQVKKMGGSLKIEKRSVECRATAATGTCAAEFDFVVTAADGARVTQPTRVTGAFARGEGGWRWTHWHSSLSAAPPAPPAPLAAAAGDLRTLPLAEVPGIPGVKGALLWEDPATGASATVTEFPAGAEFPAHFHSSGLHVHVLAGTFTWTEKDGTAHEVKAGGYTYQPARAVHTTGSKGGCRFLQINQGKFDLVPVDEQGNPQTPVVPAWPRAQR